ncbi:repressor of RNA polymerase III transcription MAF1-like protein [Iris pallida]|uniref:Repressor of RNA polymerase III transcription MAF1-like protein n=1 Tax=Iris pallida TaxID=29817 RepID=A0AAX6EBY3_IRIPA|nr:repressor of RNA polymerase III transcription MAF1-like protein [Iris pallida]
MANGLSSLLESMSKAIDEIVKLGECEVYYYNPDFGGNPCLESGAIWSFNFFYIFYHLDLLDKYSKQ